MGVLTDIDNALLTRAQAFAASRTPALALSVPNRPFNPTSARYARASILRQPTDATAFRTEVYRGILQLSFFTSKSEGHVAAGNLVSDALEYFKRGTWMTSGSAIVRIDVPPSANTPLEDGSHWHSPVSVQWFCQVNQ